MYRFLDHPSEAYIEVEAESSENVFRDAALALFELMTDTTLVEGKQAQASIWNTKN